MTSARASTGARYSVRRVAEPAFTRMQVDDRRRQLLELGAQLFARHSYAELSMARIAREAGISKALLYHYFPSKQELFVATLQAAADDVRARTEPDPELPPAEALARSLDAFLEWVQQNDLAYRKLLESAGSVPEVGALIAEVRDRTSARILEGLGAGAAPKPRAAVRAWLWFIDGAILDWLEHRDLDRAELGALLLASLAGALSAAGVAEVLPPPSARRGPRSPSSRSAPRP
jgi:AcrR family transcriptional regulator